MIRLWKLDNKGRSFSALRQIEAPGFINSLQLSMPPKRALDEASWVPSQEQTRAGPSHHQLVIVAGVGKELRNGRWMKMEDEEVQNCTLALVLSATS